MVSTKAEIEKCAAKCKATMKVQANPKEKFEIIILRKGFILEQHRGKFCLTGYSVRKEVLANKLVD